MTTTDLPGMDVDDAIRNGVDTVALFATLDAVRQAPEAAYFQFRAHNEWVSGTHNRGTIADFFGVGEERAHKRTFVFDADHPAVLVGQDHDQAPRGVRAARTRCLPHRRSGQHRRRSTDQAHRGPLHSHRRHRPQWHPRTRFRGAQRLQPNRGALRHQGRRAYREAARARRAVSSSVGCLRRHHQWRTRRNRRRHTLILACGQRWEAAESSVQRAGSSQFDSRARSRMWSGGVTETGRLPDGHRGRNGFVFGPRPHRSRCAHVLEFRNEMRTRPLVKARNRTLRGPHSGNHTTRWGAIRDCHQRVTGDNDVCLQRSADWPSRLSCAR